MKKNIKERIIKEISNTLISYNSEYLNHFLCPICLHLFNISDLDNITIAHILPGAADGKISTWACKECNNNLGSDVDKWLGKYLNTIINPELFLQDIRKFTFDGLSIQGKVLHEKGSINLIIDQKRNPNDFLEKFKEEISIPKDKRTLSFSIPLLENNALIDIGFINAAYLYGFSIFGYSWIMQEHYDCIRTAIEKRDMSLAQKSVFISNITNDIDTREHYFGIATINGIYVPFIKLKKKIVFFAPYYNQNALHPLTVNDQKYTLDVKRLSEIPTKTYTTPFILTVGNNVIIYPNKGKNKMPISFVILVNENDFSITILNTKVDSTFEAEYTKNGEHINKYSIKL